MRLVRLIMFGAVFAAAVPACTTDGGAGFFIVQNNVPGEGCTITPDISSTFLSRGAVEVDYARGYLFTPVVQSLFDISENTSVDHVIFVRGADVSLSYPLGDLPDRGALRYMFSGSIFPGATTSFGFDIIGREDLDEIAALGVDNVEVQAEITMFGSVDGRDVTAETYFYNVNACRGCVAIDLVPACEEIPEGTTIRQGGTCDTYQDQPVDCCIDANGDRFCPAQVPTI
jgi:hypothetical protein